MKSIESASLNIFGLCALKDDSWLQFRKYCSDTLSFTAQELDLIDRYFELKDIRKKTYLLKSGDVCNFIAFIASGTIRYFHVKDGVEKTCDISFENTRITDLHSFSNRVPAVMNLQAMEDTTVLSINTNNLATLYVNFS